MATPVMNQAETVAMNNGPRQWQPQAATTMQRPIPDSMAGGRQQENRQSWVWAALAGLGVLHTGLAYVLMYEGMARLPAERIAVLQFVYPGAALLVDWAVYGQALGPLQSAGVGLMALALWASRSRPAGGWGKTPWRRRGRHAD